MEYKQTEHEVPLLPWKLSHSNTATCWLCSPSVFTEMWSPPDKQEEVRTESDGYSFCLLAVYHLNLNNSSSEFDRQSHHSEYTSSVPPTSRLQVGDGSMTMREVHGNPQVNNAFYAMAPNENGKDKVSVAMCKDKKCQKKKKKFVDDGAKGNWFKVTIPCGRKYDKSCLLKSIQSLCTVPFTPVDFHYEKNQARFFVQDAITASALKAVNLRILDEESQRVSIFVSPSIVPYSVQNNFTPEQMETLKVVMGKRYSTFQKYLDLQKFRFDPDLMFHDIDMFLNRRSCMAATVKTILQNFSELSYLNLGNNKLYHLDGLCDMIEKVPQLKKLNLSKNKLMSLSELEKVKGMKLEDLWLEGNPLCSIFSDESDYVSCAHKTPFLQICTLVYYLALSISHDCIFSLFHHVLPYVKPREVPFSMYSSDWDHSEDICSAHVQDGKELLAPVAMHTEAPQPVQPIMEKYAVFNSIRNLVLQFLQEYYMIYDSRDRHGLLGVYHDEACFSLVIPINASEPAPRNLDEYFKFSRDMKKLMHPHMQRQLVKHRKHDIVECLRMLPKTQHAYNSLWVDIRLQTETMLCFTVNGMFMEVEGKFPGCVRAFTRTFITTHSKNSSVCIMNDELIVRNANLKEIQSAFPTPLPIVIIPSVPTLSEEQQKMVDIFSIQTGLEPVNSQKCLADNNWNYFKAAEVFTVLQEPFNPSLRFCARNITLISTCKGQESQPAFPEGTSFPELK
uniref:nuclear RNA export factor 2-like n=1 Tax=Jaculus jaculus TaxID=51337 RepID=UPI001E1B1794|nr:nuclear RNA export factor 2-like [Jaculus jaculus]